MKKILLGAGLSLTIVACTTNLEESVQNSPAQVDAADTTEQAIEQVASDIVDVEEEILEVALEKFTGNFFGVKYPENFIASPNGPVVEHEGVTFVDTDEAYFYAPDSSVIFFVFAPQWSGAPENYLNKRDNEKASTVDKKESNDGLYTTVTESRSFSDVDGKYERAYVCITDILDGDSETRRVFGIQYANQESYDKYRDTYKAFKKSLKQFAD